ncbi:hypothetical protein [Halomonas sp. C05BenzN]|uniref:hypothetical protein n=1 Tax=Halomonas sp. C05BenzN TaxID=3411041 RepID=UPI003B957842
MKEHPCLRRDPGARYNTCFDMDGMPHTLERGFYNITYGMSDEKTRVPFIEAVKNSDTPYPDLINHQGEMVEVWEMDVLVGAVVMDAQYSYCMEKGEASVWVDHKMFFLPERLANIGVTADVGIYVGARIEKGLSGFIESGRYKKISFSFCGDIDTFEEKEYIDQVYSRVVETGSPMLLEKARNAGVEFNLDFEAEF